MERDEILEAIDDILSNKVDMYQDTVTIRAELLRDIRKLILIETGGCGGCCGSE